MLDGCLDADPMTAARCQNHKRADPERKSAMPISIAMDRMLPEMDPNRDRNGIFLSLKPQSDPANHDEFRAGGHAVRLQPIAPRVRLAPPDADRRPQTKAEDDRQ